MALFQVKSYFLKMHTKKKTDKNMPHSHSGMAFISFANDAK